MLPEDIKQRSTPTSDGCWNWDLCVDRYGYGKWDGKKAHRLAYELFVGPIPPGLTIDHVCWNKRCVNPDHLRVLEHADNASRQRSAQATRCKNGHEFTAENTYWRTPNCTGKRQCRACNRDAVRRHKSRRTA